MNVLFKHSLSAILKSCNEEKYGTHLLDLFVYYTMSDNDTKADLFNDEHLRKQREDTRIYWKAMYQHYGLPLQVKM